MKKKKIVLGLIPARGGSKSVPRKNIRLLGGKPLIAYTIRAALASKSLTWVYTSTEDEEIARIARKYGSRVIPRPKSLARDSTPMLPVVQHALRFVEKEVGEKIGFIVLLQPTVPFRKASDIDAAVRKLVETRADSVVSVCREYDFHPMRMKRLARGRLVDWVSEPEGARRQELPPAFHRNGAVYAATRRTVMEKNSLIGCDSRPLVMPKERSLNIDEPLDFKVAEIMLRELHKSAKR